MILIEGHPPALRTFLRHTIEERLRPVLGDDLRVQLSGVPRAGMTAPVVRLLNTPNMTELRDGLPVLFPAGHPIYHMAGYALAASGSILVIAKNGQLEEPSVAQRELQKYLPYFEVWAHDSVEHAAMLAVRLWEEQVRLATLRYRFGGTGPLIKDAIMVVGERVNPFRPTGSINWLHGPAALAFTSNQGCSYFLHGALAAAGGRYYLTNAIKEKNQRFNKELLRDEIALVRPARIIAMGSEAARTLADLRVEYTKTYHPQYWKRFKNKDVGELVELLRPH